MSVSVIIPVLNEAAVLSGTLASLRRLAADLEIIVVDAGSMDGTADIARSQGARVVTGARGRAPQLNAGARQASGDVFWFLHADTRVPPDAALRLVEALRRAPWGRFDVRLDGAHPLLRLVERLMNLRSCITAVATGDQALFVRRDLFEQVGGFPDIALMEDVALSKRLRRHASPACVTSRVLTSARRWERDGVLRTIMLMWWLRFAYWVGVSPRRLSRWYR
ncbi:MAG: TIGR04283 family arsenosugar biosynthesis glycosyltransferase [Gammaproteobacteria bacterium]